MGNSKSFCNVRALQMDVVLMRAFEDLENWSRRIDPSTSQLWTALPGAGNIGTGSSRYRYAHAIEDPLHSTWLFDFYGVHFAGGYTLHRTI